MSVEDVVQKIKLDGKTGIKKSLFDWICVVIIMAILAVSLDVVGLTDLSGLNFAEFLIEWLPYFIASVLLNNTLYKKGIFTGKASKNFKSTVDEYSSRVSSLSGKDISNLYDFCENYNNTSLMTLQTNILKAKGVSYDKFNSDEQPLKILSRKQLKLLGYNSVQIRAIRKAARAKIKGLSVNILMSNIDTKDPTNIGVDEKILGLRQFLTSIIKYVLSTLLLTFMAVNDIMSWGWAGILIVIFKICYIFASSYMSYFKGYDDITISLINHIARKTDILKMYISTKNE